MAQQQVDEVPAAQPLGAVVNYDDCTNDDLIIKLRMLNYEVDFCKSYNPNQVYRPLSKTYFNTQAENANAQFFYFTSLVSWFMTLCGKTTFPLADQFKDDPNIVVANLLGAIKDVDIPVKDFAPNKIRPGHGDSCLALLVMLADRALINKRFGFRAIEYPAATSRADGGKGRGDGENDGSGGSASAPESPSRFGAFGAAGGGAGGGGGEIDDRVGDVAVSDDDGDGKEDNEEMFYGAGGAGGIRGAAAFEPIKPQVEAKEWQEEVERVAPRLQTAVSLEVRDWRARVEGALSLMRAVDTMYPEVRGMLERVGEDMDKSLDRIRKREQSLGQQFVEQVEEYRGKLRRLNTLQENLNTVQGRVSAFSSDLQTITAALEEVKNKVKEYEHRASDQTPLVRIKEAVAKVRAEIKEMSLRIGVLQHTVLHYALRQQKEQKGKHAQGIAAAGQLRDSATGNHHQASYGSPTSDIVGGAPMPELDYST